MNMGISAVFRDIYLFFEIDYIAFIMCHIFAFQYPTCENLESVFHPHKLDNFEFENTGNLKDLSFAFGKLMGIYII